VVSSGRALDRAVTVVYGGGSPVAGTVVVKTRILSRKGLLREIAVQCDSAAVREVMNRICAEYRQEATLPGFRRGQAPERLVMSRFRREIESDAKAELLEQGLRRAAEQHDLDIAGIVRVGKLELTGDGEFRGEVAVELIPEFRLPEYRGIRVQIERLPDPEQMVERQVEEFRHMAARFEATADPAQEGDEVLLDYEGVADGRALETIPEVPAPLAAGRDARVVLDAARGILPASFYQGIVGMREGERKQIEVSFAEDYPVRGLAGKQATYFVQVKQVKRRILPELNDDGARNMGFENVEHLRRVAGELVSARREEERRSRVRREVIRFLMEKCRFDVPALWSRAELPRAIQELSEALGPLDWNDEKVKKKVGDMALSSARARVKLRMILHRIAEEEKLSPSQEELVRTVAQMAARSGMPQRQYLRRLQREGALREIFEWLKAEKALQFVVEQAVVEERPG